MKKKYWYRTVIYYCVLCGHEDKCRERVYNIEEKGTVVYEKVCGDHFM